MEIMDLNPEMDKNNVAIEVSDVWKRFRLYHEKAHSVKALFLRSQKTTFEEFWALKGVSFQVNKGLTFGIIGENGSGKSTMLKLLSRILRADKGEIKVSGKVSGLLELGTGFHPELTGKENIYLNGSILGLSRKEIDEKFDKIVAFSELEKFIDTPVKSYSSGMYMRLGFAVAINVNPEILLIDEVLAVGDAAFQRKCFRQIENFQKKGKTIVFVSHDLETVKKVCDVVMLLDEGKIIKIGAPNEVVNAYFEMLTMKKKDFGQEEKKDNSESKRSEDLDSEIEEVAGFENFEVNEYRYGHGDAEITDFEMISPEGKAATTINSGEKCRIRAHIAFHKEINNPVVGMTIKNPSGIEVYGMNTWFAGKTIGRQEAGNKIVVEFTQDMHLGTGGYLISLGVVDLNGNEIKPLDRRMDILLFEVKKEEQSLGFADLQSKVSVEKGS